MIMIPSGRIRATGVSLLQSRTLWAALAAVGLSTILHASCTPVDLADDVVCVKLILDTDIGNDVDDVLALGMIHSLQSRGRCELLAVTVTKGHALAGKFVDCVNTFYGRGDIPIGVCMSGPTPKRGRFLALAEKRDHGAPRYPSEFSTRSAPSALDVLRQTLAAADDGSVVIVQIGFSTNLAQLLGSAPDEASSLSGVELIRKKVSSLCLMGGAFAEVPNAAGETGVHREYNVTTDVESAQRVARQWPTRVIWSGYEVGVSVTYPSSSILRDYAYVEHHPLAEAYVAFIPPPHDRPTWDLTSVLYAVAPGDGYFDVSPPGSVTVLDDGITEFSANNDGRHHHLIVTHDQRSRLREALVQLASQPPMGASGGD